MLYTFALSISSLRFIHVSSIKEKKKKKSITHHGRKPRVPIYRRHRLYLSRNCIISIVRVVFFFLFFFPRNSCKRIERMNDSGDCIPALQHVFYSKVIDRYICSSQIFTPLYTRVRATVILTALSVCIFFSLSDSHRPFGDKLGAFRFFSLVISIFIIITRTLNQTYGNFAQPRFISSTRR